MRRLLLLPLAAVALAGCGSSSDTTSTAASTPATTSTAAAPAAVQSGSAAISMSDDLMFSPTAITVKVGTKITWTNKGTVPHNVVAESGASFQSSTFGKGKTYSYTAKTAGTIKYVCTIHPGMEGTITVEG